MFTNQDIYDLRKDFLSLNNNISEKCKEHVILKSYAKKENREFHLIIQDKNSCLKESSVIDLCQKVFPGHPFLYNKKMNKWIISARLME